MNPYGYAEPIWAGNEPACKGHERVEGGVNDKWVCRYGGGETHDDIIDFAEFALNHKVSIYIHGDYISFVDIRYSGKFDKWVWENQNKLHKIGGNTHELEPEKIEAILNSKFENCKFWDMVQARAKELYAGGKI